MYRLLIVFCALCFTACERATWNEDFQFPLIIEDAAMPETGAIRLSGNFVGGGDYAVMESEMIWFEYDETIEKYLPDAFRREPFEFTPNGGYSVDLTGHIRAGQTYMSRTRLVLRDGLTLNGPDRVFSSDVDILPAWEVIADLPNSVWSADSEGNKVTRVAYARDGQLAYLITETNSTETCVETSRLLLVDPATGETSQTVWTTEAERILAQPPVARVGDSLFYWHRKYPCESFANRFADYIYKADQNGKGLREVALVEQYRAPASTFASVDTILLGMSIYGEVDAYSINTGEPVSFPTLPSSYDAFVERAGWLSDADRLIAYRIVRQSNDQRKTFLYWYDESRRFWQQLPSLPAGTAQLVSTFDVKMALTEAGIVAARVYNEEFPGRDTWLLDWDTRTWSYIEKAPLRWMHTQGITIGQKAYFVGTPQDGTQALRLTSFDVTLAE